jgi:hypothetical protein
MEAKAQVRCDSRGISPAFKQPEVREQAQQGAGSSDPGSWQDEAGKSHEIPSFDGEWGAAMLADGQAERVNAIRFPSAVTFFGSFAFQS